MNLLAPALGLAAILVLPPTCDLVAGDKSSEEKPKETKEEPNTFPLGPVGGTFVIAVGANHVHVKTLMPAAPGAKAGLQVGDFIDGAFGTPFGVTSGSGYRGAVQDLGFAIDRAEGIDGKLPLQVLRPGKGRVNLTVHLERIGAYGPAYPLGSAKYQATSEYACKKIAQRLTENGDQGFNTGWFALALLGNPHWNDTYGRAIGSARDAVVHKFTAPVKDGGFSYAPVEDVLLDGHTKNPNEAANNGGPGNWELGSSVMFLAEYRRKTKDTKVDVALQRAAEMCANRIQWWKQPPLKGTYSPGFAEIAGIVSHGGVTGDYIQLGWGGGINATGVHIFGALALAGQAGVKMTAAPRDGHYFGFPEPPTDAVPAGMEHKDFTLDEKFAMQWKWLQRCSGDQGAVGYTTGQGGSPGDATARTPATLFALLASGHALDDQETKRIARMKRFLVTDYAHLMEAHAYTHGGQCFYQLALPFLDDRDQRYIMENWRFYFALARQPDGSPAYFGGRGNNGGDYYLGFESVAQTICALAGSVADGGLPYQQAIAGRSPDRVYAGFTEPYLTWPTPEARHGTVNAATQAFHIDVRDAKGAPLAAKKYAAAWTCLAQPGAPATFAPADAASTTATFPASGRYRLQLVVTKGGYVLTEPIDLDVTLPDATAPAATTATTAAKPAAAPVITAQPHDAHAALGGHTAFTVAVSGAEASVCQWRLNGRPVWPENHSPTLSLDNVGGGMAGVYDCVITTAAGAVLTSASARLTIDDAGQVVAGGLWSEHYNTSGLDLGDVAALVASPCFPRWSAASAVLTDTLEVVPAETDGGQRLSGWITPERSGMYRFVLAGGGSAQLLLSEDEGIAHARLIATMSTSTKPREWSAGAKSQPVQLTAGKRYFIELRHRPGGEAPVALTWHVASEHLPADGEPALPAHFCSYRVGGIYEDDQAIPTHH